MDSTLWAADQAFGDSPETKTSASRTGRRDRAHLAPEKKPGRKPLTKKERRKASLPHGSSNRVPQARSQTEVAFRSDGEAASHVSSTSSHSSFNQIEHDRERHGSGRGRRKLLGTHAELDFPAGAESSSPDGGPRLEVVDFETGLGLCVLPLSDVHSLGQVRRGVKAQREGRGLRDFVFLYPDGVRIHPRQEASISLATFGGRVALLQASRASTAPAGTSRQVSFLPPPLALSLDDAALPFISPSPTLPPSHWPPTLKTRLPPSTAPALTQALLLPLSRSPPSTHRGASSVWGGTGLASFSPSSSACGPPPPRGASSSTSRRVVYVSYDDRLQCLHANTLQDLHLHAFAMATRIQTFWRGRLAKRLAAYLRDHTPAALERRARQQAAAISIQAPVRGFLVRLRRWYRAIQSSALRIQCLIRRRLARRRLAKRRQCKEAAVRIQSQVRVALARRQVIAARLRKDATCALQSAARGMLARKQVKVLWHTAQEEQRGRKEGAAVRIQSKQRQRAAQQERRRAQEELEAITRIQQASGGKLSRREARQVLLEGRREREEDYQRLMDAARQRSAIRLQTLARQKAAKEEAKHRRKEMLAAKMLQSLVRGFLARGRVLRAKKGVVQLQCHTRGVLARRKFNRLRANLHAQVIQMPTRFVLPQGQWWEDGRRCSAVTTNSWVPSVRSGQWLAATRPDVVFSGPTHTDDGPTASTSTVDSPTGEMSEEPEPGLPLLRTSIDPLVPTDGILAGTGARRVSECTTGVRVGGRSLLASVFRHDDDDCLKVVLFDAAAAACFSGVVKRAQWEAEGYGAALRDMDQGRWQALKQAVLHGVQLVEEEGGGKGHVAVAVTLPTLPIPLPSPVDASEAAAVAALPSAEAEGQEDVAEEEEDEEEVVKPRLASLTRGLCVGGERVLVSLYESPDHDSVSVHVFAPLWVEEFASRVTREEWGACGYGERLADMGPQQLADLRRGICQGIHWTHVGEGGARGIQVRLPPALPPAAVEEGPHVGPAEGAVEAVAAAALQTVRVEPSSQEGQGSGEPWARQEEEDKEEAGLLAGRLKEATWRRGATLTRGLRVGVHELVVSVFEDAGQDSVHVSAFDAEGAELLGVTVGRAQWEAAGFVGPLGEMGQERVQRLRQAICDGVRVAQDGDGTPCLYVVFPQDTAGVAATDGFATSKSVEDGAGQQRDGEDGSEEQEEEEEEEQYVPGRSAVLTQGLRLEGRSMLASLYEHAGQGSVTLSLFDPRASETLAATLGVATWQAAGYGGPLGPMEEAQRRRLHLAMCRGVQLSRSADGSRRMHIHLAPCAEEGGHQEGRRRSLGRGLTARTDTTLRVEEEQPAVDVVGMALLAPPCDEPVATEEEGAGGPLAETVSSLLGETCVLDDSAGTMKAVVTMGLRVYGRSMLASLFEHPESLVLSLFDPMDVGALRSVVVPMGEWPGAGVVGPLGQMGPEERTLLRQAVLRGVRVAADGSLTVVLAPPPLSGPPVTDPASHTVALPMTAAGEEARREVQGVPPEDTATATPVPSLAEWKPLDAAAPLAEEAPPPQLSLSMQAVQGAEGLALLTLYPSSSSSSTSRCSGGGHGEALQAVLLDTTRQEVVECVVSMEEWQAQGYGGSLDSLGPEEERALLQAVLEGVRLGPAGEGDMGGTRRMSVQLAPCVTALQTDGPRREEQGACQAVCKPSAVLVADTLALTDRPMPEVFEAKHKLETPLSINPPMPLEAQVVAPIEAAAEVAEDEEEEEEEEEEEGPGVGLRQAAFTAGVRVNGRSMLAVLHDNRGGELGVGLCDLMTLNQYQASIGRDALRQAGYETDGGAAYARIVAGLCLVPVGQEGQLHLVLKPLDLPVEEPPVLAPEEAQGGNATALLTKGIDLGGRPLVLSLYAHDDDDDDGRLEVVALDPALGSQYTASVGGEQWGAAGYGGRLEHMGPQERAHLLQGIVAGLSLERDRLVVRLPPYGASSSPLASTNGHGAEGEARHGVAMRGVEVGGAGLMVALYHRPDGAVDVCAFALDHGQAYEAVVTPEQWAHLGLGPSLSAMDGPGLEALHDAIFHGLWLDATPDGGGVLCVSLQPDEAQQIAAQPRSVVRGLQVTASTLALLPDATLRGGDVDSSAQSLSLAATLDEQGESRESRDSLVEDGWAPHTRRASAVTQGVRVSGRSLLVSLFDAVEQEVVQVLAFDPVGVRQLQARVAREEWEAAGLGFLGALRDMSHEERVRLHAAICAGVVLGGKGEGDELVIRLGPAPQRTGAAGEEELEQKEQEAKEEEEEEEEEEDEAPPPSMRRAAVVRGARVDGRSVLLSLYHDPAHGVVDVHVFDAAASQEYCTAVRAEAWAAALGLPLALPDLSPSELHELHNAICHGVHLRVQERVVSAEVTLQAAPVAPPVLAAERGSTSLRRSVDTEACELRKAAVVRGVKSDGRCLLVSVKPEPGRLLVQAFDPLRVSSCTGEVWQAEWEAAGYDLDVDHEALLEAACMGLRLTPDGELQVDLPLNRRTYPMESEPEPEAAPSPSLYKGEGAGAYVARMAVTVRADAASFRAVRAQDLTPSVRSGRWLPNASDGLPIAVPVASEVGTVQLGSAVLLKNEVEGPYRGLDFSDVFNGALTVQADADAKLGGQNAKQPAFCQQMWKSSLTQLPAYSEMPLAYVVTMDEGIGQEHIASMLQSTLVQNWQPCPPTTEGETSAQQTIALHGRPVTITVTEKRIDNKLNVHLTFSEKGTKGSVEQGENQATAGSAAPPAFVMNGGSAAFEDCVFDSQDHSSSIVMHNVDATFSNCLFARSGAPHLLLPSADKRLTITRGLELRGRRALASVYDQDGMIGIHVFFPEGVETYMAELQPEAWRACGYSGDVAGMSQVERMQLYNAIFTGIQLAPMADDRHSKNSQAEGKQGDRWHLSVQLAPPAASPSLSPAEGLPEASSFQGEDDDCQSVASLESLPGMFPMAITRGVKVGGKKLLVTIFESERSNEVHVQAFDPLSMHTYSADIASPQWVEAGYAPSLQHMQVDEKRRLYNSLFASFRLTSQGKNKSKVLQVKLLSQQPPLPVEAHEPRVANDAPAVVEGVTGPLSATRGLLVHGKRVLATLFEDAGEGRLEVHVWDPAQSVTHRAEVQPHQWTALGMPHHVCEWSPESRAQLYDHIFASLDIMAPHGLVIDLDNSPLPREGEGADNATAGHRRLRSSSLTRGQRVSGKKMLVTVFENMPQSESLTVQIVDPSTLRHYTARVAQSDWKAAGHGASLKSMTETQRNHLLDAVLSSCFLVLDPDSTPLDYKVEIHLEPRRASLEAVRTSKEPQAPTLQGRQPRAVTRGLKLDGRYLLVTVFEDSVQNLLEVQGVSPSTMQTFTTTLEPHHWLAHGYPFELARLSEHEREQLHALVFRRLRLDDSSNGKGALYVKLTQDAPGPELRALPSVSTAVSSVSGPAALDEGSLASNVSAVAAAVTRGVKVGGRRLLVTLFTDREQQRLEVSAFDPNTSTTYAAVVEADAWVTCGYPKSLSDMTPEMVDRLHHAVFKHIQLVKDGQGDWLLRVQLGGLQAVAPRRSSESGKTAMKAEPVSVTQGVRVGQHSLLVTIAPDAQGGELISVQALSTKEMKTYMTTVAPAAWQAAGYSAELPAMDEAERTALYDSVFLGIHIFRDPLTRLRTMQVRLRPKELKAAPTTQSKGQLAVSRGIKLGDRHVFASLFVTGHNQLELEVMDPMDQSTHRTIVHAEEWQKTGWCGDYANMDEDERARLQEAIFACTAFTLDEETQPRICAVAVHLGSFRVTGRRSVGQRLVTPSVQDSLDGRSFRPLCSADYATSVMSGRWLPTSKEAVLAEQVDPVRARQKIEDPDCVAPVAPPPSVVLSQCSSATGDNKLEPELPRSQVSALMRGGRIDGRRVLVSIFLDKEQGEVQVTAFDPLTVDSFEGTLVPGDWAGCGYGPCLADMDEAARVEFVEAVYAGLRRLEDGKVLFDLASKVDAELTRETEGEEDSLGPEPQFISRGLSSTVRGMTLGGRKVMVTVSEEGDGSALHVQAFDPMAVLTWTASLSRAAWTAVGYGPELSQMDAAERRRLIAGVLAGLLLVNDSLVVSMDAPAKSASQDSQRDSMSAEARPEARQGQPVRGITVGARKLLVSLLEATDGGSIEIQGFDLARAQTHVGRVGVLEWAVKGYGGDLSSLTSRAKKQLIEAVFASLEFVVAPGTQHLDLHAQLPDAAVSGVNPRGSASSMQDSSTPDGRIASASCSVEVDGLLLLLSIYEDAGRDVLIAQAFDPLSVATSTLEINGRSWRAKGYAGELKDMRAEEKAGLFDAVIKGLRVSQDTLIVDLSPVQQEEEEPLTDEPPQRLATAIRGATVSGRKMMVSLFEEPAEGRISLQAFDPVLVETFTTSIRDIDWRPLGYGDELYTLSALQHGQLVDAIFQSLMLRVSEENRVALFIDLPLRLVDLDTSPSPGDAGSIGMSSLGLEGSQFEEFDSLEAEARPAQRPATVRGVSVGGRRMLVSLHEAPSHDHVDISAFDPASAQSYPGSVSAFTWGAKGYGALLSDMMPEAKAVLFAMILSNLSLSPDATTGEGNVFVDLPDLGIYASASLGTEQATMSEVSMGELGAPEERQAALIRGLEVDGRYLLVSVYENTGDNCLTLGAFDTQNICTHDATLTGTEWAAAGFEPMLLLMSPSGRTALFDAVLQGLHLAGEQLIVQLARVSERAAPSTAAEPVQQAEDEERLSEVCLSHRASSTIRGMTLGGRKVMVTVFGDRVADTLEVQAFNPRNVQTWSTVLPASAWEQAGYGGSLAELGEGDRMALISALLAGLRLETNQLRICLAPRQTCTEEASRASQDSRDSLSAEPRPAPRPHVVMGMTLGNRKLLVSLHEALDGASIELDAFLPSESKNYRGRLALSAWEAKGYGPRLTEMSPADKARLLDATFMNLQLNPLGDAIHVELPSLVHERASSSEGDKAEGWQSSCTKGVQVDGKRVLVSIYENPTQNKLLLHAFDPLAVYTYVAELGMDAWSHLGYGGTLAVLDMEQRLSLIDAALAGLRIVDGELTVHLTAKENSAEGPDILDHYSIEDAADSLSFEHVPAARAKSSMIRGTSINGRKVMVTIYEEATAGRLDVQAFDPRSVVTWSCSLKEDIWSAMGYGAGLMEMEPAEKTRLLQAVLASLTLEHDKLVITLLPVGESGSVASGSDISEEVRPLPRAHMVKGMSLGGKKLLVSLYESASGEELELHAFAATDARTFYGRVGVGVWERLGYGPRLTEMDGGSKSRLFQSIFEALRLDTQAGSVHVDLPAMQASVDGSSEEHTAPVTRRVSLCTKGVKVSGRHMLVSLYEMAAEDRIIVHAFDPLAAEWQETSLHMASWSSKGYGGTLTGLSVEQKASLLDAIVAGLSFTGDSLGIELALMAGPPSLDSPPDAGKEDDDSLGAQSPPTLRGSSSTIRGMTISGHHVMVTVLEHIEGTRLDVQVFDPVGLLTASSSVAMEGWRQLGYGGPLTEMQPDEKARLLAAVLSGLRLEDGKVSVSLPSVKGTSQARASDCSRDSLSDDQRPATRPSVPVKGVDVGGKKMLLSLHQGADGLELHAYHARDCESYVVKVCTSEWEDKGYGPCLSQMGDQAKAALIDAVCQHLSIQDGALTATLPKINLERPMDAAGEEQEQEAAEEPPKSRLASKIRGMLIFGRRMLVTLYDDLEQDIIGVQAFDVMSLATHHIAVGPISRVALGHALSLVDMSEQQLHDLHSAILARLVKTDKGVSLRPPPSTPVRTPVTSPRQVTTSTASISQFASPRGSDDGDRPNAALATRGVHISGRSMIAVFSPAGPQGHDLEVQLFDPVAIASFSGTVPAELWAAAGYGGPLPSMTSEERRCLLDAVCAGVTLDTLSAASPVVGINLRIKPPPVPMLEGSDGSLSTATVRSSGRESSDIRGLRLAGHSMFVTLTDDAEANKIRLQAWDPIQETVVCAEVTAVSFENAGYGSDLASMTEVEKKRLHDAIFANVQAANGRLIIDLPRVGSIDEASSLESQPAQRRALSVCGMKLSGRMCLVSLIDNVEAGEIGVQAFDMESLVTYQCTLSRETAAQAGYTLEAKEALRDAILRSLSLQDDSNDGRHLVLSLQPVVYSQTGELRASGTQQSGLQPLEWTSHQLTVEVPAREKAATSAEDSTVTPAQQEPSIAKAQHESRKGLGSTAKIERISSTKGIKLRGVRHLVTVTEAVDQDAFLVECFNPTDAEAFSTTLRLENGDRMAELSQDKKQALVAQILSSVSLEEEAGKLTVRASMDAPKPIPAPEPSADMTPRVIGNEPEQARRASISTTTKGMKLNNIPVLVTLSHLPEQNCVSIEAFAYQQVETFTLDVPETTWVPVGFSRRLLDMSTEERERLTDLIFSNLSLKADANGDRGLRVELIPAKSVVIQAKSVVDAYFPELLDTQPLAGETLREIQAGTERQYMTREVVKLLGCDYEATVVGDEVANFLAVTAVEVGASPPVSYSVRVHKATWRRLDRAVGKLSEMSVQEKRDLCHEVLGLLELRQLPEGRGLYLSISGGSADEFLKTQAGQTTTLAMAVTGRATTKSFSGTMTCGTDLGTTGKLTRGVRLGGVRYLVTVTERTEEGRIDLLASNPKKTADKHSLSLGSEQWAAAGFKKELEEVTADERAALVSAILSGLALEEGAAGGKLLTCKLQPVVQKGEPTAPEETLKNVEASVGSGVTKQDKAVEALPALNEAEGGEEDDENASVTSIVARFVRVSGARMLVSLYEDTRANRIDIQAFDAANARSHIGSASRAHWAAAGYPEDLRAMSEREKEGLCEAIYYSLSLVGEGPQARLLLNLQPVAPAREAHKEKKTKNTRSPSSKPEGDKNSAEGEGLERVMQQIEEVGHAEARLEKRMDRMQGELGTVDAKVARIHEDVQMLITLLSKADNRVVVDVNK